MQHNLLDGDTYRQEVITIVFNDYWFGEFTGIHSDNLKENIETWKQQHPKRKHLPMDWLGKTRNGMLPSWNRFINCPSRIIQDTWKKDLNEYTTFCIEQQHVPRAYLDECIVAVIQFRPTKAKADNDNTYIKASLDASVKNEIIKEDNYTVVRYVGSFTVYDKESPRTELRFYPVYAGVFDFEFVMDYMNEDIKHLEKIYG